MYSTFKTRIGGMPVVHNGCSGSQVGEQESSSVSWQFKASLTQNKKVINSNVFLRVSIAARKEHSRKARWR